MIQQLSSVMRKILIISFISLNFSLKFSLAYNCSLNQCYNHLPTNQMFTETLSIHCNLSVNLFDRSYEQRYYSILQTYSIRNCSMKTFFFDQYTLWNYLEYLSITYANLTSLSTQVFQQKNSLPILYRLKTFNISHNLIRKLNKNISIYLPSLEKFDLSYNQLSYLHKKTFENLLYLKELYLNNNQFKQILSDVLPIRPIGLLNLNHNPWNCTCTNVLMLVLSRPVPQCMNQNQNASLIARQCFLRSKTNLILTMNSHENLTCLLTKTISEWKKPISTNQTIQSIWHIEQQRIISFEQLVNLYNRTQIYFLCFNFNSTMSELIHSIIPLKLSNKISQNLSPFFRLILKFSKIFLPKIIQQSEKYVLITWLILLACALIILIYLIYSLQQLPTHSRSSSSSRPFLRFDRNIHDHRTLFNVKLTCQNHKCLCQYRRRRAHSSFYLTPTKIPIEPNQLRYAKIKRLSSTKIHDEPIGQFRTRIQFQSLPN